MKDQHDKRTGNLLATPNAIRQARFAEQQRAMGRKARKVLTRLLAQYLAVLPIAL